MAGSRWGVATVAFLLVAAVVQAEVAPEEELQLLHLHQSVMPKRIPKEAAPEKAQLEEVAAHEGTASGSEVETDDDAQLADDEAQLLHVVSRVLRRRTAKADVSDEEAQLLHLKQDVFAHGKPEEAQLDEETSFDDVESEVDAVAEDKAKLDKEAAAEGEAQPEEEEEEEAAIDQEVQLDEAVPEEASLEKVQLEKDESKVAAEFEAQLKKALVEETAPPKLQLEEEEEEAAPAEAVPNVWERPTGEEVQLEAAAAPKQAQVEEAALEKERVEEEPLARKAASTPVLATEEDAQFLHLRQQTEHKEAAREGCVRGRAQAGCARSSEGGAGEDAQFEELLAPEDAASKVEAAPQAQPEEEAVPQETVHLEEEEEAALLHVAQSVMRVRPHRDPEDEVQFRDVAAPAGAATTEVQLEGSAAPGAQLEGAAEEEEEAQFFLVDQQGFPRGFHPRGAEL